VQKKWVRFLAALLAGIILMTGVVYANELEQKFNDLQKVQDNIRKTEGRLSTVRRQEQSLLQELTNLERRLERAEQELAQLERNLAQTERNISATTQALNEAEAELEWQTEILGNRLRALYENGSVSYLEVILGATTFSDFINRVDLMQEIIAQDVSLLEMIQQKRAEIAQKKIELENQKAELLVLQERAQAKQAQLASDTQRREVLLDAIHQERRALEAALDELEQTSRQLEEIIRQLQLEQGGDGLVAPSKGSMIWPTGPTRRVSSEFGNRRHPILGYNRFHSGIDIAAPHGQAVYAAASGKVLFSGVQGGYGNTVIINHGGGISTLYGHNSSLLVKAGQVVARGQIIARVGSTGLSTGPHVHFEVRINGSPNNPRDWLLKK
jgi:murein DD-endopeptidase MepM/ murein hydrolase activator NlpD